MIENILKNLISKTIHGNGDSDKHLMTLFAIALGSNSKRIIELGVRNGDTTVPLTLAAKYNGGVVHSVDIEQTALTLPEELKQFNRFYKEDAISFLRKEELSNNEIDLIYIDDWHSAEHVRKELEILDRIVTPKTIILLHDLMYGGTDPFYHVDLTLKEGQWANGGPYVAVSELNNQFWEFSTLPFNNGLTILRKKYSNKYKQK